MKDAVRADPLRFPPRAPMTRPPTRLRSRVTLQLQMSVPPRQARTFHLHLEPGILSNGAGATGGLAREACGNTPERFRLRALAPTRRT